MELMEDARCGSHRGFITIFVARWSRQTSGEATGESVVQTVAFVTNVWAHVFQSHAFYRFHFCTPIWLTGAGDESIAERLINVFLYVYCPTECPSHPQLPYILVWAQLLYRIR